MNKDLGYKYHAAAPPQGQAPEEALKWALQELEKVSIVVNNLAEGRCALLHKPPAKPRNGMVRMADGTNWNPGSGRGYYGYDEDTAAWRFLG